ncbi:septation initiation network scaffold protein cdc11 [Podospora conica]|nr:septation initiation network scaffold protein cdc11 [Schizothecium conicum]
MGEAWLDSLSEDWVSQPGSDHPNPDPDHEAQDASSRASSRAAAATSADPVSRIPRFNGGPKKPQTNVAYDIHNSSRVLSERSVNELLTSPSRRTPNTKVPSKLSCEIKLTNDRGRQASRSYSDSVSGSVIHNTVQHKSLSTSPAKGRHDTPEWKRRLVYGQLPYGEQPDLFTSATTGLENMFKPPPPAPRAPEGEGESYEEDLYLSSQHEVTLPSSPPQWARDPSTAEIHVDESLQVLPGPPDRRPQTSMRYRQVQDSEDPSMDSEPSVAHDSQSQAYSTTEQTAYSTNQQNQLDPESRKVSGRSDVRHEDFSPILLQRRQASNGKETFGPAELPPTELRKRLENLRRNQKHVTGDYEDSGVDAKDATADFERMGGFVNFRRGGRSTDDSFRHRVLSSGMNDTSELNPEESLQASTPKRFPTVRMESIDETYSPDVPRPPNPSPLKQAQGSASSPLKLFQPYDTFTNQTLLHRMSQFQGDDAGTQNGEGTSRFDQDMSATAAVRERVNQRWEEEEALHRGNFSDSLNEFGTGKFDGYEFHDECSYQSNEASVLQGDREHRNPEDDAEGPAGQHIFDLSHNSSPAEDPPSLVVQRKRGKSNSSSSRRSSRASASDKRELHPPFPNLTSVLSTPKQNDRVSDIKRPRSSPAKDSTPKRRRTLHKSDIGYDGPDESETPQLSHQKMQAGRKRKDAREGEQVETAEADMLASRQLLRPRTPTPTQRSSVQRERPLSAGEKSALRSSRKSQLLNSTHLSTVETDRKPSIKTEDFINEANKIMAMIRSKAGVASGLASLEESDAEYVQQLSPDMESSYEESTQEPFSRPPSREGGRPVTRISARQEDPEVVERLKMYEEASDMGDIIGCSIRSTVLENGAIRAAREPQNGGGTASSGSSRPSIWDGNVISDPPNIRISHKPNWRSAGDVNSGVPSHASSGSESTTRSIPTGSSRGSETKKVIAPESVLHLIPDQVGNMVLDKQKNIWIKRRAASIRSKPRSSYMPSEASEDDPFADIPDLTVDMTLEMQNLRLMTAQKEAAARDALANGSSPKRHPSHHPANNTVPPTDDENEEVEHEISIGEDRVDPRKRRNLTISFSSPIASVIQDRPEDETQNGNDISAHDDSLEELMQESIKRGRRAVSLQNKLKTASSRSRSRSQGPARRLSVRGQTFVARPISRIDERDEESVVDRIKNQQRPVSNMELSIVAENSALSNDGDSAPQTSLSFLVRTPARSGQCPVFGVDAAPIISQYVGTLSLSPLSEFTVHHGEETLPLEASYVVGDHRLVTGDRSKRVMSMNTRDLVGKLAEVEPFEPYWDDMRDLQLSSKRLESLHNLSEFCHCLERLDVSNNEIRNLNGIPSSVRHLKMSNNQLTGLTAWSHLMNLQYVDVSNNALTSLAVFKNLVHLRSLRVDNNQLTNLDGIKFHDGLLSLRARGNAIEEIDFDGNRLDQLTDLDLKDNRITRISNLSQLPALDSLNLEGNRLSSFAVESDSPPLPLRYLRLNDNHLTSLTLTHLPHLRLLHADRNLLTKFSGLSRARHLDSLSLREQRGSTPLDTNYILSRAYEVRKLFLSGNLIETLSPTVDLLNLQLLELANCGIKTLPQDFGLMLPNLRAVNLGMNALVDLAPLRYVPRLKRVLVAGNRIADAAALVDVLQGFKWLREVDVRDNPVTQGFYCPATQVIVRGAAKATDEEEEKSGAAAEAFALPEQDKERDEAYCGRLDMETRMRRRLYEQMVVGGCARVKRLDGLGDKVWEALRERGLVLGGEEEQEQVVEAEKSERWGAEDSFA